MAQGGGAPEPLLTAHLHQHLHQHREELHSEGHGPGAQLGPRYALAGLEPVQLVGMVAQLLTYASFLSGAQVCRLIHREGSCAKLSPVPFMAGVVCSALWLRYGLVAEEGEIVTVNVLGLACQTFYLAFFGAYSRDRGRLGKQLVALLCLVGLLMAAVQLSPDRLLACGSLASLSSLVACASPLATIGDVLRTRCVASLPFPIIVSSFVVSLSWLAFGWLKGDAFIQLTNAVTVSISGAQLALFALYPSQYAYEKLSQSNKKSYDLIRLLGGEEEEEEEAAAADAAGRTQAPSWPQIDSGQDYKAILAQIMGQIYLKRDQLTKQQGSQGALLLLLQAAALGL